MMMGSNAQQYCLRWNNHRSNLLTVFDELLRSEAFTDVTLACEGGTSVKCHKMVLAACSSYFQSVFTELPCQHPVVVLKDVKYGEMKAILEYMYRGEVNVAQDQLAALLKVAEALKVKGLVDENMPLSKEPPNGPVHSPPSISTSASAAPAPHSSVSPPQSSGMPSYDKHAGYNMYGKSPVIDRGGPGGRMPLPMWAMPGLPPVAPPPHSASMLNSCYEAASSDMSPLKRKKLQSLLMSRDTPILRTVLGQTQADSSQPMSLVCQPDSHERIHSNGSANDNEKPSLKPDNCLEEARSPYTDISGEHDDNLSDKQSSKMMMTQSFTGDMRGVSSGIATYVPTQKPEWKRYKQYTRNDIMSAIDAVRSGMSALQAARKYGVPSRTLYDKVKKMGITTSRPFNKRGSNISSGSYFPYGNSGGGNNNSLGMYPAGGEGEGEHGGTPGGSMEPLFLQHALDGMKRELGEREALAAMAAAASRGSGSGGSSSSPGENGRSPSPPLKYIRQGSVTPDLRHQEEEEDHVEDLSVSRKQDSVSNVRVIMPPMSLKKEDSITEENRMNLIENAEHD